MYIFNAEQLFNVIYIKYRDLENLDRFDLYKGREVIRAQINMKTEFNAFTMQELYHKYCNYKMDKKK